MISFLNEKLRISILRALITLKESFSVNKKIKKKYGVKKWIPVTKASTNM